MLELQTLDMGCVAFFMQFAWKVYDTSRVVLL